MQPISNQCFKKREKEIAREKEKDRRTAYLFWAPDHLKLHKYELFSQAAKILGMCSYCFLDRENISASNKLT